MTYNLSNLSRHLKNLQKWGSEWRLVNLFIDFLFSHRESQRMSVVSKTFERSTKIICRLQLLVTRYPCWEIQSLCEDGLLDSHLGHLKVVLVD